MAKIVLDDGEEIQITQDQVRDLCFSKATALHTLKRTEGRMFPTRDDILLRLVNNILFRLSKRGIY